jgi:ATP-dependent DNA ligase
VSTRKTTSPASTEPHPRATQRKAQPPRWIQPQLTRLVAEAPDGSNWLHEIKYDGYRMHARLDGGDIRLLTRTGLDWSHRYQPTIAALRALPVKSAYIDGELCALRPDGTTSFSRMQAAMDEGRTAGLCSSPSTSSSSTARTHRGCR